MKIAFCFHHSEPSGATLWLKNFLLDAAIAPDEALAVFPSHSPLIADLEAAHVPCRTVQVQQTSLTTAGGLKGKATLAANRLQAVRDYAALFRSEAVDLVYVNSSVQVAPMLAAQFTRRPYVVHVHEAWRDGRFFFLKKLFVRSGAAGALFASQSGMELFGGEPHSRTWLFSPNGMPASLQSARAERAEVRAELGLSHEEPLLLFLGTLSRRKGLHDLLTCWPRLRASHPRARLLIAGTHDPHDSPQEITAFLRDGLAGATYLGFRRDARRLMAGADLLVLPSYGEAMPLVLVEAMMMGTPCVARDVGDVRWLLQNDRGFVFHGEGHQPLESAIRQALAAPPAALQAMADNAQQFALANLTREQQNAQIMEYLRQLMRLRQHARAL